MYSLFLNVIWCLSMKGTAIGHSNVALQRITVGELSDTANI